MEQHSATTPTSDEEPQLKRLKSASLNPLDSLVSSSSPLSHSSSTGRSNLEERLGGIVMCTVCLDDSKLNMHQCPNGHLMCVACLNHLLTDARLKDEQATCPSCRCEISRALCCRSLVAEKVMSQLPTACSYCKQMLLRGDLDKHEKLDCAERSAKCRFERIGCTWQGAFHELEEHVAANCFQITHRTKSTGEIMAMMRSKEGHIESERAALMAVFSQLSMEKIQFNDLQFKPYKTDEITPKLYFETARFSALGHQWALKAHINDNQKNPNLAFNRYLSYQLILKSKASANLELKFVIVKGPFCEVAVEPKINTFEFGPSKPTETEFIKLPLESSLDCNKLLSSKVINIRFFMFQV